MGSGSLGDLASIPIRAFLYRSSDEGKGESKTIIHEGTVALALNDLGEPEVRDQIDDSEEGQILDRIGSSFFSLEREETVLEDNTAPMVNLKSKVLPEGEKETVRERKVLHDLISDLLVEVKKSNIIDDFPNDKGNTVEENRCIHLLNESYRVVDHRAIAHPFGKRDNQSQVSTTTSTPRREPGQ